MKISTFGLKIQPGKYKYQNICFDKLVEKFSPQKVSPYTVEFIDADFEKSDAAAFNIKEKFDFVFIDLEKVDKRLLKSGDEKEKILLEKARRILEEETLLCDAQFSDEEKAVLKTLSFVTYKPSLGKQDVSDINGLIGELIEKAGLLLFFTAGKKEVRAWDIKKGETVLAAAGRIHSDLARGFIKAEVTNCGRLDEFHNMAEAKSKGFIKVVDRDYVMQEGDIIEIRFSV